MRNAENCTALQYIYKYLCDSRTLMGMGAIALWFVSMRELGRQHAQCQNIYMHI